MGVLLFEDAQVIQLAPISLTRPAYTISCGAMRLDEAVARWDEPMSALVRSHLEETERSNRSDWAINRDIDASQPWLAVNARLLACPPTIRRLQDLRSTGGARVLQRSGILLAGWFPNGIDPTNGNENDRQLLDKLLSDQAPSEECSASDLPTFEYPHDVVRLQLDYMSENLEVILSEGSFQEVKDGLFVEANVEVAEQVAIDTRNGPIVLQSGATVRPFVFLRGPILIGQDSRINEHSSLKDGVCVGHTVKIGGEVERATIEPYTNNAHDGFLGHSYLGQWVNLGAGTNSSNLKNTYGNIRVQRGSQKMETGMQFFGCIVGDFSKSAINTSIYTGVSVGVASTLYGTVTENVPSFVNYAHSLGSVTEMSLEAMLTTQGRMFERRGVEQRECDVQLLRHVFDHTAESRHGLESGPPTFRGRRF